MKNLISIIGPRRSGLHAVCNWLIGLFPGRVQFVNDPSVVLPPDLSNFLGCIEYEVSPEKIRLLPTLHLLQGHAQRLNRIVAKRLPWPCSNIALSVLSKFWDSRLMSAKCPLPEIDGSENPPPDTHIVLFENLTPVAAAHVLPSWLAAYRIKFELPPVERESIIIVLRNPWNCLASTLNHPYLGRRTRSKPRELLSQLTRTGRSSADNDSRFVPQEQLGELWTAYAKEINGESQYLKPPQWHMQPLLYEAWLTTRDLRAAIAGNLGRSPDDRGLSRTAIIGGGGSFDGQKGVASKPQDLANRWRQFQHHSDMRALVASSEIRRLSASLGMTVPIID
jgi:hypothetical protein